MGTVPCTAKVVVRATFRRPYSRNPRTHGKGDNLEAVDRSQLRDRTKSRWDVHREGNSICTSVPASSDLKKHLSFRGKAGTSESAYSYPQLMDGGHDYARKESLQFGGWFLSQV